MTKPHYRSIEEALKEAKAAMAQDIAPAGKFALPAHLQGKPKTADWGPIDPRQRMLPRIKLLQASNPEIVDYPGEAKPGEFWHTTLTTSLGPEILAVPIVRRQSYTLWAPRTPGETRGILARSRDSIHWDPPEGEFHIRFPMNPKTYTWRLKKTVRESGLDQFGSSREDDPKSPPAATLTFEVLWFLPEWNTLALTMNTRSGVKEARKLFAMVDAKPASPFNQKYKICAVREQGPQGEVYYGYKYRGEGYCDEQLSAITEPMFAQWRDVAFATADETEDEETLAPRPAPAKAEPRGEAGVIDNDEIPF